MTSARPDPQETAWCAGLPQSGQRALTPAEVVELRALAARFLAQGRGALAVALALLFCSLAAGLRYSSQPNPPPVVSLGLFLSVCIIPLGAMLTRDWLGRARSLQQDADSGWLRQFTGQLPSGGVPDETRDRLLRRRLLLADPHRPQWFEVLPRSELVWTANGYRTPGWVRAIPNVLAEVPEYASTAAQWVSPVEQPGSEGIHLNFRDLTTAERGEVRRHSQRLLLRPLGGALLFTLWAAVPFFSDGFNDVPAAAILFGALAGWSWWNVIRVVGTVAKLRRDAEIGRVVIVRRALDLEAAPSDTPDLSAPDEFLPESGIPWTIGEKPASWRHNTSGSS